MVLLSAIKGSYLAFGNQIASDLTGKSTGSGQAPVGYIYWVSSIIAVGLLGYYSPLQKFSRTFMFLIILGMVLANKGLFNQLADALKQGPKQSTGSTSASATPATATASNADTATTLANATTALNTAAELLA